MLHSDAKHPVCAYKWMNWSLTPKVQGDVAAWFGSLPVVPKAVKPARCWVTKAAKPTATTSSQNCILENAGCRRGKYVPYSRWTQDYIAIMGGR
jgi:putative spermidine/putrescine transport system substrate-binding protein